MNLEETLDTVYIRLQEIEFESSKSGDDPSVITSDYDLFRRVYEVLSHTLNFVKTV